MAAIMLQTMSTVIKDRYFFNLPWLYKDVKAAFRASITATRDLTRAHLQSRMAPGSEPVHDILSYIIKGNTCSDQVINSGCSVAKLFPCHMTIEIYNPINDPQLTIEHIVDDYLVFLAAGMETTAITMAVTIFYLMTNR